MFEITQAAKAMTPKSCLKNPIMSRRYQYDLIQFLSFRTYIYSYSSLVTRVFISLLVINSKRVFRCPLDSLKTIYTFSKFRKFPTEVELEGSVADNGHSRVPIYMKHLTLTHMVNCYQQYSNKPSQTLFVI